MFRSAVLWTSRNDDAELGEELTGGQDGHLLDGLNGQKRSIPGDHPLGQGGSGSPHSICKMPSVEREFGLSCSAWVLTRVA
jgi:hypothetical protein